MRCSRDRSEFPWSSLIRYCFVLRLNPQLGDTSIQGTKPHAQTAGRLLLVWRLPQDALNVLLLEALDRFAEVVHQRRIAFHGGQIRRQVGRRDKRSLAEN